MYYNCLMQNAIENHKGRFGRVETRTQKRVHNAKVFRINPHYISIVDRHDGKTYKYKRTSFVDVSF